MTTTHTPLQYYLGYLTAIHYIAERHRECASSATATADATVHVIPQRSLKYYVSRLGRWTHIVAEHVVCRYIYRHVCS